MAGGVRDILRLQFIFGGLDAPTLVAVQPEIFFASAPIARVSQQTTTLAFREQVDSPIARKLQAGATIATKSQASSGLARVEEQQVNLTDSFTQETER